MTTLNTVTTAEAEYRRGFWATFSAFALWGVFPLYWHALIAVPSLQIMAHRIIWCTLSVCGYLFVTRGRTWLLPVLQSPRLLGLLCISSVLVGTNWGLYIWAVNHNHVVESALGYFINPLVSVLLGVFILRERLRSLQWMAVAIAAIGVIWLTVHAGRPPWIALMLAISFGSYGLIRKIAAIESIPGLGIESALLFIPGLGYLLWQQYLGQSAFGNLSGMTDGLLIFGGLLTAAPLIWFAFGARRIPLSTVGILQYIGPTIQLLIGVLWFDEPFTHIQASGFACIWAALGLYAVDSLVKNRIRRMDGPPAPVVKP